MPYRDIVNFLRTSRFLRDERGSATIEFVLWVPIFTLLLVATTDATVLYLSHTEMWNVSRDIARRVAIGDITEAEAEAEATSALFLYSHQYTVTTSLPDDPDVVVVIETSVADASVFGIFSSVLGRNLSARVVMRREPI